MNGESERFDGIDPLESEEAALLGASLRPVAPPPALREELMRRVRDSSAGGVGEVVGSSAEEVGPRGDAIDAVAEGGGGSAAAVPGAEVVDFASARSSRRRLVRVFAQMAASFVILAVGVGVGRWSTMEGMESTSHYAQLNQAQDVDRVTDTMPDGHVVTLTWSKGMDMAAVTLPAELRASKGRSLQVWVRQKGVVTKAGMYEPAKGTTFSFLDVMPEPGIEILITEEPEGGSDQPTGDPLVVLRIGEGAKAV